MIKSRRLRLADHVARMEESRSAFKILTSNISLGRPSLRLADNIRMDLKEIRIHWVELAHDRGNWRALVNAAFNLRVL